MSPEILIRPHLTTLNDAASCHTGLWLVESDHITWILASDWSRVIHAGGPQLYFETRLDSLCHVSCRMIYASDVSLSELFPLHGNLWDGVTAPLPLQCHCNAIVMLFLPLHVITRPKDLRFSQTFSSLPSIQLILISSSFDRELILNYGWLRNVRKIVSVFFCSFKASNFYKYLTWHEKSSVYSFMIRDPAVSVHHVWYVPLHGII